MGAWMYGCMVCLKRRNGKRRKDKRTSSEMEEKERKETKEEDEDGEEENDKKTKREWRLGYPVKLKVSHRGSLVATRTDRPPNLFHMCDKYHSEIFSDQQQMKEQD